MSDPVAKVLRIYDPAACRISIGGSPVDCVAGEWGFWSECWTRRYVVFPNTEQTAREMCAEYARGLGPAQASEQPPHVKRYAGPATDPRKPPTNPGWGWWLYKRTY
jgi:hypothetical protein